MNLYKFYNSNDRHITLHFLELLIGHLVKLYGRTLWSRKQFDQLTWKIGSFCLPAAVFCCSFWYSITVLPYGVIPQGYQLFWFTMQDFISFLLWSIVAVLSQFLFSACRKKTGCVSINLKFICKVLFKSSFAFGFCKSEVHFLGFYLMCVCKLSFSLNSFALRLLSTVHLHGFQMKRKKCQVGVIFIQEPVQRNF